MAENERMEKTIAALKESFNGIRTGRASASIFDRVRVDYYGQKSPLNQVATVSIPEARSVIINPFDKSLITEIEKAILTADLGLNPSNDGKVIRIAIPPLTADRRKAALSAEKKSGQQGEEELQGEGHFPDSDGNHDLYKSADCHKAGEHSAVNNIGCLDPAHCLLLVFHWKPSTCFFISNKFIIFYHSSVRASIAQATSGGPLTGLKFSLAPTFFQKLLSRWAALTGSSCTRPHYFLKTSFSLGRLDRLKLHSTPLFFKSFFLVGQP